MYDNQAIDQSSRKASKTHSGATVCLTHAVLVLHSGAREERRAAAEASPTESTCSTTNIPVSTATCCQVH